MVILNRLEFMFFRATLPITVSMNASQAVYQSVLYGVNTVMPKAVASANYITVGNVLASTAYFVNSCPDFLAGMNVCLFIIEKIYDAMYVVNSIRGSLLLVVLIDNI